MNHTTGSAPNFTKACIVLFGVNLAWVFFVIWAVWGLLAAAAAGLAVNHIINFIEKRRG